MGLFTSIMRPFFSSLISWWGVALGGWYPMIFRRSPQKKTEGESIHLGKDKHLQTQHQFVLVGGWLNQPLWKNMGQIGSFHHKFGVKIKNRLKTPQIFKLLASSRYSLRRSGRSCFTLAFEVRREKHSLLKSFFSTK